MANVKHAVFVSSDIRATRAGHMLNLVHTEDCDNGTIWAKGEPSKDKNSREVYKAAAAKAEDKVYVIGHTPLLPRAKTKAESAETNFYNEAGSIMRAYALEPDDRFEVSVSLVKAADSEVKVGQFVVADTANAGKYEEKATDEGTAAFTAVIREIKTYGYGAGADKRILVEVVRNGFCK